MSVSESVQTTAKGSPSSSSAGFVLQRKCACGGSAGFSGDCDSCRSNKLLGRPLQRKLAISEPGDRYEQEADRIANQVMASSGSDAVTATPVKVQRFTGTPSGQQAEVPASVERVLASSGQPLETGLREDMEARFGHDFSRVRVHTDAEAANSARAVNALAYTVGLNIVLGEGQYKPETHRGRQLLAHELAHVLQQHFVSEELLSINITGDGDSENEASEPAHGVASETFHPSLTSPHTGPILLRQALPAPVTVRPPMRPPLRVIRGCGVSTPGRSAPRIREGERYATTPYPETLEEMFEPAGEAHVREVTIWDLERPLATLVRGGSPPTFITVEREDTAIGEYGTVRYRIRVFHILDAIEYEVGRAETESELIRILDRYIPPSGDETLPRLPLLPSNPMIPEGFDPGGEHRIAIFNQAVVRRSREVPSLSTRRVAAATLAAEAAESEEPSRRRRHPNAYPICWPVLLGPPMLLGLPVEMFIRTPGAERDEEDAEQRRLRLAYRAREDPDFIARRYHIHHSVPLFLGGLDATPGNLVLLHRTSHIRGHADLRYQPQMLTPPCPLAPLPADILAHPSGTPYELVGFKERRNERC